MLDASHVLQQVFGFDQFRNGQHEIISAVLRDEPVLAIMPTGGGKSLCYQIPALTRAGTTLVVSPLIALMRDQVNALRANGVAARYLCSACTEDEVSQTLRELEQGEVRLLYMAPERLASERTVSMLKRANVVHIAVDEAHCVSQWGHDFRPDYLEIGRLKRRLNVSISAFTATADEDTRSEIITRLFDGETPNVFLYGFDRPNIHLSFAAKDKPRQQILNYAVARRGTAGIVYCGTRAKTESLAKALRDHGLDADYYHGGMDPQDRARVEKRFNTEDALIVVATVAFGMGVDKPDIRWVAHADLPKSIESYYQEIGRAGRDGADAEAYCLYGVDDIRLRRTQIDESLAPPERRSADHGRLNALLGLAETVGCRRVALLSYFGEGSTPCGNCDVCSSPPDTFDASVPVQKALSAILRTGSSFGSQHLVDVLVGKKTEKITKFGHEALPTFGVGRDQTAQYWNSVLRQMMGHDLVRPDREKFGALVMTEKGREILKGVTQITFRKDSFAAVSGRPKVVSLVSDEDAPLLSALKAKRRALAEQADLPAYMIFADRTLVAMAQDRPNSLDELIKIPGVGAKKLDRYGQAFLEVISPQVGQKVHPKRRKLAVSGAGSVFDRLIEAQASLVRGPDGLDKPLSCSASALAKLSQLRPSSLADIERLLGSKKTERFGASFLEILEHS